MASIQRLKKEIDYVVSGLVLDCFTYISLYQKPNDEETMKIVQDTLTLRNQLRDRANHPEQKDKSETFKSYYDNIAKTLLDAVDQGYSRLGKLVNKDA